MISRRGHHTLCDTDGRPITTYMLHMASQREQPYLDVVRCAVRDVIDGVCGPELTRIIARDYEQYTWHIGVEEASQTYGDDIIHDWLSYGNSIYDVIDVYVLNIRDSAPKLMLGKESRRILKLLGVGSC